EIYVSGVPRQIKQKSALEQIYHLTLLATNTTGFHNLNKLVSIGYLDGFYRQPRVDLNDLAAHNEGLICLSGCLSAEIPTAISAGQIEKAEKLLKSYLDIFDRNRFYLEVQRHGIPQEDIVTKQLVEFGRRFNLKLVATNDSHYINQQDAEIHDILLCIQMATSLNDPKRLKYFGNQFYLKSCREMAQTFAELPRAVTNTLEIGERCHFKLDFETLHIPKFELPKPHTHDTYLMHLSYFGFANRYQDIACQCPVCNISRNHRQHPAFVDPETIEDSDSAVSRALQRLHYELSIIQQKRIAGYFLIVQDLVGFAKRNDIPVGAGRGSAAGSLVSYLLGITEVDPLKYNLFFERFLNPERISMPDIDIDFGHRGRDKVFEYVSGKYGRDHVAHIATLDTLSARTVIRDVGRSLGLPYPEVDRIAKTIPRRNWSISIDQALRDSEKFRKMVDSNPNLSHLVKTARNFEGMPRHASIHAAGVIITDEPLTHHVALQYAAKGEVIAQMTMKPVERLGLLKMDLLGLRFISAVHDALKTLKQTQQIEMTENDIPLDDAATYKMLCAADTEGLFQVESQGMRKMLRQVRPSKIEDVMAVISLYRPGPMQSGLVDQFIDCQHGRRKASYLHPRLEPILKDTHGAVLYQEQVMQVARAIAGYSLGEADTLRRYMGKVQKEAMKAERSTFIERAKHNGVESKTSEAVFDMIQHFGGYGFNKAHAAGYAVTVYHTAYMKCNYFLEYWTALLNSYLGFTGLINRFVRYARRHDIEFLPPDINQSTIGFTLAAENKIRCGI
ncbi:MAG: DNA polymerase III subunit alpha, partial [Planctomycetes bacterium]|nr:DNA polymerase III subunit alpha [Planctomycetota bacterium]